MRSTQLSFKDLHQSSQKHKSLSHSKSANAKARTPKKLNVVWQQYSQDHLQVNLSDICTMVKQGLDIPGCMSVWSTGRAFLSALNPDSKFSMKALRWAILRYACHHVWITPDVSLCPGTVWLIQCSTGKLCIRRIFLQGVGHVSDCNLSKSDLHEP